MIFSIQSAGDESVCNTRAAKGKRIGCATWGTFSTSHGVFSEDPEAGLIE
jgi:hypothetical protein